MDENLGNNEVESEQIMLIHKDFTESDVVRQTTTALSILALSVTLARFFICFFLFER